MQIYILRHGEAESHESANSDASRALTPKGKTDVRQVLKTARDAGMTVDRIISSPLVRARQTAGIAGKLFGIEDVAETKGLLPGATPQTIWRELTELRDVESVLLAGHEPHVSRLVQFILEAAIALDFKKSGLVRIDSEARPGPPRGVLKWMITPRLVRDA